MGCESCLGIIFTTPAQHFPKSLSKEFGRSSTTGFSGKYSCKQLIQKIPSNDSDGAPICWRDTEIYRVVNDLNLTNIIIADIGLADAAFWDVHIGERMKSKGPISDCTHNCMGLLNEDHSWWIIH